VAARFVARVSRAIALSGAVLGAAGCASSADAPPLADVPRSSPRPAAPAIDASTRGSLFPMAGRGSVGYRPLFEDRRARSVGDTLTVVLNERTSASRRSGAAASRASEVDTGITRAAKVPFAAGMLGFGLAADGNAKFEGKGNSTAENDFAGTITVTVIEVLQNGNLAVAGEKRLAVSAEEEVIRFSGIVNPADVVSNSVSSVQVADARIEYRGRGASDDVQKPGWLTRGLLKVMPF
jgi:flagellar L-ring protein precursor FlgH